MMQDNISPPSREEHKESQRSCDDGSFLVRENPVSKLIVDCAFKVHTAIGP